jgi:hypothetical protein
MEHADIDELCGILPGPLGPPHRGNHCLALDRRVGAAVGGLSFFLVKFIKLVDLSAIH